MAPLYAKALPSSHLVQPTQAFASFQSTGSSLPDYAGQLTLCFNDGVPVEQTGHSTGTNRFLSPSYTDITPSINSKGDLRGPDNHEENTPDGSYLLQTVFQPRQLNLTSYGGPSDGWILDGCFQQISLPSGDLEYEWCAYAAGIALNETAVHMRQTGMITNPVAGNGSPSAPWDPYHINSVARDAVTGDYVVSLRHCNALVRICGAGLQKSPECSSLNGTKNGQVAWRLGGARSDFGDVDFGFSGQHMVRFHNGYLGNNDNTTLSIFNDASDGATSTADHSSGLIFTVDYASRTARLVANYSLPDQYTMLSVSQGSFQLLPNGNTLIGWGSQPYYSEFNQAGELLYHAGFGLGVHGMQNYRAFKYPWVGAPQTQPDLVAYAGNCSGEVYAYVSWNGATEVDSWMFHGSNSSSVGSGGWRVLARVPKEGFETATFLSGAVTGSAAYVRAQAMNRDGRVIGVSDVL
ncbi:MAG: hypothetical protein Q9162_005347 [Coniocarpon cinnabarinum]